MSRSPWGHAGRTAAALLTLGTMFGAQSLTYAAPASAASPIKHVVVIFQENVSFDHYFGTYPHALNRRGEQPFKALPNTPDVNGLTGSLLTNNPNLANPQRLSPADQLVCDQDHEYDAEQAAWHGGLLDRFVQNTSGGSPTIGVTGPDCKSPLSDHKTDQATNKLVMDYYDGNTVTALWNYAQHFTLFDNSFGTTFGPSTPGALNLVSGDTSHATAPISSTAVISPEGTITNDYMDVRGSTIIGDPDAAYDDCSSSDRVAVSGKNVGDLLNAKGITWGWFEGGFRPTAKAANGNAVCGSSNKNVGGTVVADYSAHHEPFQYYASTSNPHHLAPSSTTMIGKTDQANHQYDLTDFNAALAGGSLPAVSFLKAAKYQDGHAGYSDPADEQQFLVGTINAIEKSPYWSSTAIIISYDDSDGFYDHVSGPIVHQSTDVAPDGCGTTATGASEDRCGYGPRLPLLLISPFAKTNFVDHQVTDQTSILRFIEDNWNLGRIGGDSFDKLAGSLNDALLPAGSTSPSLTLDPKTGEAS